MLPANLSVVYQRELRGRWLWVSRLPTGEGRKTSSSRRITARLLRQQGVDLANFSVPEPDSGRRWLHVWNSQVEAQAFADELKKRTKDLAWEAVEVKEPPSEGPLGPVEIQVVRRNEGWAFALHPLSRLIVQRIFPDSCTRDSIFIRTETKQNRQPAQDEIADLAEQVVVILTGLDLAKITDIFGGYRIYDPLRKLELADSRAGSCLRRKVYHRPIALPCRGNLTSPSPTPPSESSKYPGRPCRPANPT